jgi:hypothetical protein
MKLIKAFALLLLLVGVGWYLIGPSREPVNPEGRFYISDAEIPALEHAAASGDTEAIKRLALYYELYRNGDPRARQYLDAMKQQTR